MKKGIKNRLYIKVYDKRKKIIWIEVKIANLGSLKKPNKKILSIKYEPFNIEEDRIKVNRDFRFFK